MPRYNVTVYTHRGVHARVIEESGGSFLAILAVTQEAIRHFQLGPVWNECVVTHIKCELIPSILENDD